MYDFFGKTRTELLNRYINWRAYKKAVDEMYSLSDSTLNDIGIHRSQIKAFVAASMQQNDNDQSNDQSAA